MKPISEKRMQHYNGIRGLRICQNEECKLPQNRDRTGASNVGLQFTRLFTERAPIRSMTTSLFEDKAPIRSLSEEDLLFHRATLCLECSD